MNVHEVTIGDVIGSQYEHRFNKGIDLKNWKYKATVNKIIKRNGILVRTGELSFFKDEPTPE